jgi:hypothetical protein
LKKGEISLVLKSGTSTEYIDTWGKNETKNVFLKERLQENSVKPTA